MVDGSSLPVKFSVLDNRGRLVVDSSVQLALYDDTGAQRLGPFVFGRKNPNWSVDTKNKMYMHVLHTNDMGLIVGRYQIRITLDSTNLIGRNSIEIELLGGGVVVTR